MRDTPTYQSKQTKFEAQLMADPFKVRMTPTFTQSNHSGSQSQLPAAGMAFADAFRNSKTF